jgi:hypothetical protein
MACLSHEHSEVHRAIKHRAAEEGVTMGEMLRELLEERYRAGQA